MITYKKWKKGNGAMAIIWRGWYLFGFIPLYKEQLSFKGHDMYTLGKKDMGLWKANDVTGD